MKRVLSALVICFIMIAFVGCGAKSNDTDAIVGDWKAYGTKIENDITSYEESGLDKETVNTLKNKVMSFKDDGKVTIQSGQVSVEGSYEKEDEKYVVKIKITESDEQTLNCYFEDKYLIVEQVMPEGFEDADAGDPEVYKRD